PVGNGYVTSLAHPTGNVTGLVTSQDEAVTKQLQLVALLVPNLHRIGFLLNRDNPTHVVTFKSLQEAAQRNHLTVVPVEVRNARDLADAFTALNRSTLMWSCYPVMPFFFRTATRLPKWRSNLVCQPCLRSGNTSRPAA